MNEEAEATVEAVRLATYAAWREALKAVNLKRELSAAVYQATRDYLEAHGGPR